MLVYATSTFITDSKKEYTLIPICQKEKEGNTFKTTKIGGN